MMFFLKVLMKSLKYKLITMKNQNFQMKKENLKTFNNNLHMNKYRICFMILNQVNYIYYQEYLMAKICKKKKIFLQDLYYKYLMEKYNLILFMT